MKVNVVGGGPAGLFFALMLKRADARHSVTVIERSRPEDTWGFGVVFSDATEEALAQADPAVTEAMARHAHRWDDIEIQYRGDLVYSGGHGFSGLARRTLLRILADRCREIGVVTRFEEDVADLEPLRDADLLVGADGLNSRVREAGQEHFRPAVDLRPNRFVWLGTTRPFPAFTFSFRETEHGLWRAHAYQYERDRSTFIVEAREETWRAAGLDHTTEDGTIAFCGRVFAEELRGHRLLSNRSVWRSFPTLSCGAWHHGNVALIGDAAHTAHFSVGSGTKMAMEDAISLAAALGREPSVPAALAAYEAERRGPVESLQRAAQASLRWFEDTERYMHLEPVQFAFALLTRSLRVTHQNLKVRDPQFVAAVDRWYEGKALAQAGPEAAAAVTATRARAASKTVPPMFTPFRMRDMVLANRVVVSPMCQYLAEDGTPNDWHLVHLGARAIGGAGLVIAEMTDVSREARISPGCTGLYAPGHAPAWRRIVDFVHANSAARIGVQLGHAGRKGSTRRPWEGEHAPLPEGNWPLLSASAIPYLPHLQAPREMTRADMEATIENYVRAARLAQEAGFDMLELHMAHGYLLAAFLSPLTNRRTDAYGGALEGRLRFPLEVFAAVRAAWPAGKPVTVRLSAVDWAPGGNGPADAVAIAKALRALGCDAIDVSTGQTVPEQAPEYGRLFQTPFAERVRHEAGLATMAVGNISSYADVNTILAAGRADLCLLARAHLWDPYWTRHAAFELGWPLAWPDPYATLNSYRPRFT